MGVTGVCRHRLRPALRVSDCLLLLIRLHQEPHEQHSNEDNHEVEEKFLCGSLHFRGCSAAGRGRQAEQREAFGDLSGSVLELSLQVTGSFKEKKIYICEEQMYEGRKLSRAVYIGMNKCSCA